MHRRCVVLGGAGSDLFRRRPELGHVIAGLHGIGVHEDGPVVAGLERLARSVAGGRVVVLPFLRIVLVDAAVIEALDLFWRIRIEGLLHPQGQADVRLTGEDIHPGAAQSQGGGGTATLDIGDGGTFGDHAPADQWRQADLTTNAALTIDPHAAIAEPDGVDCPAIRHAGIGQNRRHRLFG